VSAPRTADVLDARGLHCGYLGHPVVRDLSIQVRVGEVVALLGANGAGKTTTLKTLAGEIPAISGEVRIAGKLTTQPMHIRTRNGLAYVSEERPIFAKLSTADNLRLGRCNVEKAVSLFPELVPLLSRRAGQLSGGEQQMLTVARALAREPRILLADELSLGLAPKVLIRLLDALRSAADTDGVGVLLVEQHVHQALRYADHVYVLTRGELTMSGTAAEVGPRLHESYLGH
jgi:branched-chain amino acid transport system ATP-binding protein